jgi:anti-sigma B factor antagonist
VAHDDPVDHVQLEPDHLCAVVSADTTKAAIDLVGELDQLNHETFVALVERLSGAGYRQISLNAAGLSFCDLSGLRALITADDSLRAAGGQLTIRAAPTMLRTVLTVTRLGDRLSIS